jgi:hypothetical protein
MSDPLLDAFGDAWQSLRDLVERLDAAPADEREGLRDELVTAVDRALTTRTRARERLAAQHGGYGVGDQVLFVREVEVGALARELDGFIEGWPPNGGGLLVDEILKRVRPLLVEPGSPEAHDPA